MFGLIGKIRAVTGCAEELAEILTGGSGEMPGCLEYLVAVDVADPDVVWVTEVWSDRASHEASLQLPSVRAAIARGRPLIAGFELHVETSPRARDLPSVAVSAEGTQPGSASHLISLQRHGAWADAALLGASRTQVTPVPEALRELAHVRGAQETWLARIEGRSPSLAIWPALGVAELASAGRRIDDALEHLVTSAGAADLARPVSYQASSGAFTTELRDILLHLFLHGQYHRGKANAALRQAGAGPVAVDYIAWRRAGSPPPSNEAEAGD